MKMVQVSAYKMSEEDGVTLNDKDSETNFWGKYLSLRSKKWEIWWKPYNNNVLDLYKASNIVSIWSLGNCYGSECGYHD